MDDQFSTRQSELLDDARQQLRAIHRLIAERAELVASGSAHGKRVAVTVNADNIIIETKFGPGIEDLSPAEIAAAVTEAGQLACTEMARKTRELIAPAVIDSQRLPQLTELVEDIPDLEIPKPVAASTAPPNSRERHQDSNADPGMHFTDTEDYEPAPNSSATDSAW